jgi:hypothetical protein
MPGPLVNRGRRHLSRWPTERPRHITREPSALVDDTFAGREGRGSPYAHCATLTELPGSMRSRIARVMAALAVLGAISAGCTLSSTPEPTANLPVLGISNGTSLDVTVLVNNVKVAVAVAGGPSPTLRATDLPALPWDVEARTASGRVLTSMHVEPGQVWSAQRPDGGGAISGVFGRVDLSCGRVTIWAGDSPPSGPAPPASPGKPGDCSP